LQEFLFVRNGKEISFYIRYIHGDFFACEHSPHEPIHLCWNTVLKSCRHRTLLSTDLPPCARWMAQTLNYMSKCTPTSSRRGLSAAVTGVHHRYVFRFSIA